VLAVLLSPLIWAFAGALFLALRWHRVPPIVRLIVVCAECALILLLCPIGANMLVRQIESRVPASEACATSTAGAIVVLSGGLDREPVDEADVGALDADSVRRAVAGIAVWQRNPDATLVFAGGGPYAVHESALLQELAKRLGVPAAKIAAEGRSQTTWENAEQVRALTPPLPDRIVLVSSAIHLPRALVAFRAAGFEPCPYVSDRRYLPPGGIGYFIPQSSALVKSEAAIHELVGEANYRWRARRAPH